MQQQITRLELAEKELKEKLLCVLKKCAVDLITINSHWKNFTIVGIDLQITTKAVQKSKITKPLVVKKGRYFWQKDKIIEEATVEYYTDYNRISVYLDEAYFHFEKEEAEEILELIASAKEELKREKISETIKKLEEACK